MKSRRIGGFNAVVLVCILALAPSSLDAAPRERETPRNPAERIVRIIKQIRNLFTPTIMEDGVTPPKP